MKKQIFNFMVGAALLSTNPLFAMEPIHDENPHISISPKQDNTDGKTLNIHECFSCSKMLRFTTTGKGSFDTLNEDTTIFLLSTLSIMDILNCSELSQGMYNVCQNPVIWKSIIERENLKIDDKLCAKEKAKEYLNIFTKNEVYEINFSQLMHFFKTPKTPCARTWINYPWSKLFDYHDSLCSQSCCFSIGKRKFELYALAASSSSIKEEIERIRSQYQEDIYFTPESYPQYEGYEHYNGMFTIVIREFKESPLTPSQSPSL